MFKSKQFETVDTTSLLSAFQTGCFYLLPDVQNFRLNKYGLPSYTQVNTDIRYSFAGILKGLEAQLLLVWKKMQVNCTTTGVMNSIR